MAFILCENHLRGATILEDETDDFTQALDGRLTTQATMPQASGDRYVRLDCGSAVTVDTMCMARHNLGSITGDLQLYRSSDDVTYNAVFDGANWLFNSFPGDTDKALLDTFTAETYRYWRIEVWNQDADFTVADFAIGERIDLERDQKHGFIKPDWADGDRIMANVTRGNNLAGLTVKEGFKRCKFQLFYYSESWFDTNWETITAAMKDYPIYISFDTNNSEQLFYCWPTNKMPEPRYSKNINGYYDVTLDMTGITL